MESIVEGRNKSPAKWRASISYTDPETNKRVDVRRRFESEGEARRHLWGIQQQLSQKGTIEKTIKQMTVAEVAQKYTDEKPIPAVIRDGRHIAGRLDLVAPKTHLRVIVAEFGKRKMKSLTYGDLARFRTQRLQTPTRYGKPRTARTVNAEMGVLRGLVRSSPTPLQDQHRLCFCVVAALPTGRVARVTSKPTKIKRLL